MLYHDIKTRFPEAMQMGGRTSYSGYKGALSYRLIATEDSARVSFANYGGNDISLNLLPDADINDVVDVIEFVGTQSSRYYKLCEANNHISRMLTLLPESMQEFYQENEDAFSKSIIVRLIGSQSLLKKINCLDEEFLTSEIDEKFLDKIILIQECSKAVNDLEIQIDERIAQAEEEFTQSDNKKTLNSPTPF